MLNSPNKSDYEIVIMIAKNNLKGWEHLYDKYSSSVHGVIYVLCRNKNIAENILMKLFLQLKNDNALNSLHNGLCSYLMNYTFTFSLKELKQQGLEAHISTLGTTPKLIHLFCAKNLLPKEEETKIFDTTGRLEMATITGDLLFESVS